jgi:hypothetical protein
VEHEIHEISEICIKTTVRKSHGKRNYFGNLCLDDRILNKSPKTDYEGSLRFEGTGFLSQKKCMFGMRCKVCAWHACMHQPNTSAGIEHIPNCAIKSGSRIPRYQPKDRFTQVVLLWGC